MKKIILVILGLLSVLQIDAQQKIRIIANDGSFNDFWVEGVKSIRFLDFEIDPKGETAEAIDLGLSVKWASWNLGATNEYDFGGYYKRTENLVSSKWGSDWRLPTEEELNELYKNCTHEVIEYEDLFYVKFIGKNGNYIILPLGGCQDDHHLGDNSYGLTSQDDGRYLIEEKIGCVYIHKTLKKAYLDFASDFSLYSYTVRPVYAKSTVTPSLSIDPSKLTLGSKKNSTDKLNISCNVDWTISGIPSWASFSSTSGNGNKEITITAKEEYEGANDRDKAEVVIKTVTGNKNATLQLSQKGVGMNFSISGSPVNLGANAGATGTFVVKTNFDFTITNDNDWLEVTPTKGNTTTTVTVKAKTANPNTTERTAKIYVSNMLLGASLVEVKQAAGEADIVFIEPYTNWGASRSTVKSVMKDLGYTILNESTKASENYYINYIGKGKETVSQYQFDSSQNLYNIIFLFLESKVSLSDLRSYLSDTMSYQYAGANSDKGQYFYLSKDKKSYAIVWSSTNNGEKVTMMQYVSYSRVSIGSRQKTRGSETILSFDKGYIYEKD